MELIHFKFSGLALPEYGKRPVGWLAVGNHGVHNDGTPLLSSDCTSVEQIEQQAKKLKNLIDEAVEKSKRKLPTATPEGMPDFP
jgi:hypothetical protein